MYNTLNFYYLQIYELELLRILCMDWHLCWVLHVHDRWARDLATHHGRHEIHQGDSIMLWWQHLHLERNL